MEKQSSGQPNYRRIKEPLLIIGLAIILISIILYIFDSKIYSALVHCSSQPRLFGDVQADVSCTGDEEYLFFGMARMIFLFVGVLLSILALIINVIKKHRNIAG